MKKKIKVILLIIAVAAFLAITIPRFLFTNGLPADDKVFNAKEFNTIMGGAYSEARYNRGMSGTKHLENVFADHEKAMTEIKKMLKSFLFELKVKYSLPELSAETIDQYQEILFRYREDNYRAAQGAPIYKLSALSYFCQTYKNSAQNRESIQAFGMKTDLETAMSYIFNETSTSYIVRQNSLDCATLLVADLLEYMKTTFELEILTDSRIPEYRKYLDQVPDDPYASDKEILRKFFEVYTAQQN